MNPRGLLCDECDHLARRGPQLATWRLEGVDRLGLRYRALTCDGHVELAQDVVLERGGVATLAPLDAAVWSGRPYAEASAAAGGEGGTGGCSAR